MNLIEHIWNPKKIIMIWQTQDLALNQNTGRRFVVGEIINNELTYYDNDDVSEAKELGFTGLTAYPYDEAQRTRTYTDVETVLERRLPPQTRADYKDYLSSFGILPECAHNIPSLTLLSYTRGKLPGDGFSFYPILEDANPPFDISFNIAGFRHHGSKVFDDLSNLKGESVTLLPENENQYDSNAVAIMRQDKRLGYIPKGLQTSLRHVLQRHHISATIERINGVPERPNVLVIVKVKRK